MYGFYYVEVCSFYACFLVGFFFIINGCWILSNGFSAPTEIIIWFLSFNLLMCITSNHQLLNFYIQAGIHLISGLYSKSSWKGSLSFYLNSVSFNVTCYFAWVSYFQITQCIYHTHHFLQVAWGIQYPNDFRPINI